jgi:hypothetical protein
LAQVYPHEPPAHTGVALARAGQVFPQVPQCRDAERRSVSQPFTGLRSQSDIPVAQTNPHAPLVQRGVALPGMGQALPHAPQFCAEVARSTQPPLQYVVVLAHDERHDPRLQSKPAGHTLPHAPQLALLAVRSVSQPFAGLPSQSPKPVAQVAMAQRPMVHAAEALGTWQRLTHAPQRAGSLFKLVSQPLAGSPSQSPHPCRQVKAQRAPAQAALAFGRRGQTLPHWPQLRPSLMRSASQPSSPRLLQLARPLPQESTVHRPELQAAVAPARAQVLPQAPQCAGSLPSCTSQPLEALPSQSA